MSTSDGLVPKPLLVQAMKKTAQNVPRIGLARVDGEHLTPANDPLPPSEMKKWQDDKWTYTPSGSTDIRRLFAKVRREQKKERT